MDEQARTADGLEDRESIANLMTGWIHRDLAEWVRLRELFHPDGTIEVSWFHGLAGEFVDGAMRMSKSDLRTKHFVGGPVVTLNGNKAIVETNAVIVGANARLRLGACAYSRFFDQVEKRNGVWKILKRRIIYDSSDFKFPRGVVEIDHRSLKKYPGKYAPLAYLMEKSGFPVKRVFATKGSDLEESMKADGQAWLAA
jgi:hypothetical protein